MAFASSSALLYAPDDWASEETRELHALLCTFYPQYLTLRETVDIIEQLSGVQWKPNQQVLWTGLGPQYKLVDAYARDNGFQTLRNAMGPLMDTQNPNCLRKRKTNTEWGKYVRGASLVFAWRIAQEDIVTIVTPPPPTRCNPSGRSTYQEIELPVLKGLLGSQAVHRMLAAHPTIQQARTFPPCEIWPDDKQDSWMDVFRTQKLPKYTWRKIGKRIPLPRWAVTETAHGFVPVDECSPPIKISVLAWLICAAVFGNFTMILITVLGCLTHQALLQVATFHNTEHASSEDFHEAEEIQLELPLGNIVISIQEKKVAEITKAPSTGSNMAEKKNTSNQNTGILQEPRTGASSISIPLPAADNSTDTGLVKDTHRGWEMKANDVLVESSAESSTQVSQSQNYQGSGSHHAQSLDELKQAWKARLECTKLARANVRAKRQEKKTQKPAKKASKKEKNTHKKGKGKQKQVLGMAGEAPKLGSTKGKDPANNNGSGGQAGNSRPHTAAK